ncbi:MAG: glycosyltransferase [Bacteroidota bacterium]
MGCVCFFNTAIAWGGGEKWHLETSAFLHKNNREVLVVAHSKSVLIQRLKKTDIPFIAVEVSNLSFLNPIKHMALRKELKKRRIDTMVMNLSRDVKIAGTCAKAVGVKRIIYRRGSAIPIKNTLLNRYYFKNIVTEVLANSLATKRTVLENNPNLFPEEKIEVIYNGIDLSKMPKEQSKHLSTGRTFTLINLGRLEAQKNQRFLIYLAQEFKTRALPIKISIGGNGRLEGVLRQKIVELGVENWIELLGFIEHPIDFISKGDVFVLPSLWEGFGYVLAEAALCKKPIVAFNISSNPELVIHEETGLLVEPNNVSHFADAVEKLYRNPKLCQQMGKQGSVHVKTNFDKDKNLKEIETYLLHG